MQSYKLRVTLKAHQWAEVKAVLPLDQPYIYGIEGQGSDNPHVHLLIQTELSRNAIGARLNKIGLTGNKCFSMKKCPEQYPIEYIAYCMKQGDFEHTLPRDIWTAAVAYNEKVVEEMRKKTTPIEELEEEYVKWFTKIFCERNSIDEHQQIWRSSWKEKVHPWSFPKELIDFLIIRGKEKLISQYIIQRQFDTLMIRNVPSYKEKFIEHTTTRYDKRT